MKVHYEVLFCKHKGGKRDKKILVVKFNHEQNDPNELNVSFITCIKFSSLFLWRLVHYRHLLTWR